MYNLEDQKYLYTRLTLKKYILSSIVYVIDLRQSTKYKLQKCLNAPSIKLLKSI